MPQDEQLIGRALGEVLAQLVRKRWPRHTAKEVARAWGLDDTTARNVCRGHASERTLSKAITAEGWAILEPLGRALTGRSYSDHLNTLAEELDRAARRAEHRRAEIQDLEARAASVGRLGSRQGV